MAVYYYFLCVYTWFIITQEFWNLNANARPPKLSFRLLGEEFSLTFILEVLIFDENCSIHIIESILIHHEPLAYIGGQTRKKIVYYVRVRFA